MGRKRLNNQCGFTFIELVVCLAILAVLAAVGVARFREPAASIAVHDTARALMGDIRMVQMHAMNGAAANSTITIAANSYQVRTPDGHGGVTARTVSLDRGVTLSGAGNVIAFASTGAPGTACPTVVVVSKGSSTTNVLIMATTGKVQI